MVASKTLILGMGNPILTDDAIGCRLATGLRGALKAGGNGGLDFMEECSVGGLNLLDVIAGYDRVIVLDSIKTRGGTPGDLYRFTAADLQPTLHLSNVHDANFATALALGRRMGMPLPADGSIHVFAVEVADNETFGESLTDAVEQHLPGLLSRVADGVREILKAQVA